MKRTTRKLAIRSETVRALGVLDLARVGGGNALEDGNRTGSGVNCAAAEAVPADAAAAAVLR